ncbi:hypothetical protein [Pelagibius sp.]|uniref:hypothetical protein n=1 Tax=Pelagibius sp. TaxID=1931238 RepID=UPI003BAE4909
MAPQNPTPSGPPGGPPSSAVADLPVAATAVASFASVFGQLGLVAQAAKGAFFMLMGAWAISFILPTGGGAGFFLFLISLAASSHFGVNWCRVMLLGPAGLPARSLSWGPIQWRFLGYGMLLFLIMMLMTIPLSAVGSVLASILGLMSSPTDLGPGFFVVGLLMFLGALYVLARLGFVFPAVAVGEEYGLGLSWQHSAGQGLRLTAALFAAGLPIVVGQLLLAAFLFQMLLGVSIGELMPAPGQGLPGEVAPGAATPGSAVSPREAPSILSVVFFNVISTVANFLSFAVLFSLLCLAFRTCTGWVPASGGNLPAGPLEDENNGQ